MIKALKVIDRIRFFSWFPAAPVKKPEIKDEPGAEDRFLRGVRKAVNTPPKPFTKPVKGKDQDDKK